MNLHDRWYGGLKGPDRHDSRDFLFALNTHKFKIPLTRPDEVSLLPKFGPVFDQGNIGSCTAASAKACREYLTLKIGHQLQPLSALWVYYETRRKFWDVNEDSGAYMRDVTAILAGRGAAREQDWPYITSNWNVNPPASSYGPALWYKVNYYRINALNEMLDCLAAGWAFIFGVAVYTNWFSDINRDGFVPEPKGPAIGGHALCAAGYKIDPNYPGGGYFTVRNSWGDGPEGFTDDGNLRFSFAYLSREDTLWDTWTFNLRSEDPQFADQE